jgi:hypothetical protein
MSTFLDQLVRSMLTALFVALALFGPAGQSATARSHDVKPFAYDFRVTGLSVTATLAYAKSRATTRYRLAQPSEKRSMSYLGPRVTLSAFRRTWAAAPVAVTADAAYMSPDPSCARTIDYKPPQGRVRVSLDFQPPRKASRVFAGVGRIPLATPFAGQDSGAQEPGLDKCGKAVFGDWYQDVVASAPIRLLASKPRVTLSGHHKEIFTDPGIDSIEWTLTVVLQRVGYRPIDCTVDRGC